MTTSKNPFSIDIVLRHPSRSPESISEALSLKPKGAYSVGQNLGTLPAKWTFFHACLQEARDPSGYESALAKVGQFLEKNAAFWADFMGGNGEVELLLNHTIEPQEEEGDKSFELYLAPAFLHDLSTRGIGLRVQGWQGSVQATEFNLRPKEGQHGYSG
jgi:hypothetical protein